MLKSDALLVHYNTEKKFVLACDASPYGIGAVLSHVDDNHVERPIAFASRSLTKAEKGYSQLDKEALAIVFGVKRFHSYLVGRSFIIHSDHQPLFHLFHEAKAVSSMASARLQRWALTLSAYQYHICYKPGKQLANADALSRLPSPSSTSSDCLPGELTQLLNFIASSQLSIDNIKQWTATDPVLSRVKTFVISGWPADKQGSELQPYVFRQKELSLLDGCLLWGSRLVVPPKCRKPILDELHETHLGITRMKGLARGYVWWPGMDSEIESCVKERDVCQRSRPVESVAPLHPWEWPKQPWHRVHLDFAGPFLGHSFLVIDTHSKWLDIAIMQSLTSSCTIERLQSIFSTHGLPHTLVTDNAKNFTSTSEEFKAFIKANGIIHITSALYHPSTNGLAERAVQSFK